MAKLQLLEEKLDMDDENVDDDEYNTLLEQHELVEKALQDLDYRKDESVIRRILYGLGFDQASQNMKFSQFSGGWKMRVSLGKIFDFTHLLFNLIETSTRVIHETNFINVG